MDFEWDEQKRRKVLAKHGVDFVDVAQAMAVDWFYELPRPYRRGGELRFDALVELDTVVLRVTYTYRGPDVVRLITARRADKDERQTFFRHRPV